jgi:uridylate kinase
LKIVIKIGGHVFSEGMNPQNIISFAEELKELRREGHKVIAVAGGGEEARKYIKTARLLGASEYACDILGIEASRLNARLLIAAMGGSTYPIPPKDIQELLMALESEKIIVAGGMQPGQSTNAVAALIAESIGADILINATNIDGVYTSDPDTDPSAKKFDEISTGELLNLLGGGKMVAGSYDLFDITAIRIVERSRITTRIINGKVAGNIIRAVRGEAIGTLVLPKGG